MDSPFLNVQGRGRDSYTFYSKNGVLYVVLLKSVPCYK